jgi:hypothetical protein
VERDGLIAFLVRAGVQQLRNRQGNSPADAKEQRSSQLPRMEKDKSSRAPGLGKFECEAVFEECA